MSWQLLQTYIGRLEEHATPGSNDVRHMRYIKYINAFLSCFGKEKAYLVGSTGEKLKLRSSKHGGDADFLFCSGRLEIPIDNIEERPDLRCYVKIRTDGLRQDICGNSIDGYLSANMLRDVRPELFTFLRAIYTEVTSNVDTIPDREGRITTIGVPMKVGLGRTEFRNLEIEGDILSPRVFSKRVNLDREAQVTTHLKKRWRGVHVNLSDRNMLQRILKLVRMAKIPGSKGEHGGQINQFAYLLDAVMQRIPLEQEQDTENAVMESDDKDTETDLGAERLSATDSGKKVKATCTDMTAKDFVPALRIVGDRKLKCLIEWRKRIEKANWPPRNIAEEIFNTDVFVVARDAPMKPDHLKDFCLSFNLAEIKLGQCLSTTQRRVFLILKSYMSGILQRLHTALGMNEMKLKTYYLKTAFFWVCEREDPTLWSEHKIIAALRKVLHFLLRCLQEKKLSHYFVNSNLFAELEELDCDVLQNCIQEILNNPVESIGEFKFLRTDNSSRREIWLTAAEVQSLQDLKDDGGRRIHMDKIEDELIDMQRGFNESTRDADGRAPIKEAILKTFDIFVEEERQKQITNRTSNITLGGGNSSQSIQGVNISQASAITGLLSSFVTGGGSQSMNSREANERMDFLVGLGSLFPGGSEFISNIGGRDGVQNILQKSADRNIDHAQELKTAIDKYLSCSDDDEESLALELKQKITAYFLGRQE